MLKRYAFSFYEVVIRIERLRRDAWLYADPGSYSGPEKAPDNKRDDLTAALMEMRAECVKLDLAHTPELISHIEKGKDYTYADMMNHLDTLSFRSPRNSERAVGFILQRKGQVLPEI
jgi:hypothetical protein